MEKPKAYIYMLYSLGKWVLIIFDNTEKNRLLLNLKLDPKGLFKFKWYKKNLLLKYCLPTQTSQINKLYDQVDNL